MTSTCSAGAMQDSIACIRYETVPTSLPGWIIKNLHASPYVLCEIRGSDSPAIMLADAVKPRDYLRYWPVRLSLIALVHDLEHLR